MERKQKPHAVCIPYPSQGHVNPMLKLAKLLQYRGFHITFVNTEYNHRRLLRSRGLKSLDAAGVLDFRFETIPDGLPPASDDANSTQDVPSLCYSTSTNCLAPFSDLICKLNHEAASSSVFPPVSCIVYDGVMTFALDAARKFNLPAICFWTASTCGLLGYAQYRSLIQRGLVPLTDMNDVTNGYLEKILDWVPGVKDIRLKDVPSFIRTTDINDIMLNFFIREIDNVFKSPAIIINTFDSLEQDTLDAISNGNPRIYTVGPLDYLLDDVEDDNLKSICSNLWKEDSGLIEWLDQREPNSVVYVNFGSITVMTSQHFIEFAWGLANSKKPFLWIVRPDIVSGETPIFPPGFLEETKERGLLASWCRQEQVLKHRAIAGFLTHCGWNSTLESICGGIPLICWPFFGEQPTNCRYSCKEWGVGMEIDNNVKRDEVEKLVRELIDGEKGKKMKKTVMDWKKKAEEACRKPGGSSIVNFDRMLNEVLHLDGVKYN